MRRVRYAVAASLPCLLCLSKHAHFLLQSRTKLVFLNLEIITRLEIKPKAIGRPKVPRKTQGCVGADRPLSLDNLVDPPGWYVDGVA